MHEIKICLRGDRDRTYCHSAISLTVKTAEDRTGDREITPGGRTDTHWR